MATFVLIHGAWHGGWCWRKVCRLLRSEGHDVFAPTLTGLGDRRHLRAESTGLNTHIEDIVNVLFYEDLNQVVLVGHSYAGFVITGVADCASERIQHLVFLDASTPEDGQSIADLLPESRTAGIEEAIQCGMHQEEPPQDDHLFGISDQKDLEWLVPRLAPQPMGHAMLHAPVSFKHPDALQLPRTFIKCTHDSDDERQRFFEGRGFRYKEIESGHDAMVEAPQQVAEFLLACLEDERDERSITCD